MKESNCKYYITSTEQCRKGCNEEEVLRLEECPFYPEQDRGKYPGDFQGDCFCYA